MDWIKVDGNSMRPFLRSGDFIAVEWMGVDASSSNEAPHLGELLLGQRDSDTWIVHRMIAISRVRGLPPKFVLKGDAAYVPEILGESQIWGRVVSIRRGKKVSSYRVRYLDRIIAFCSRRELRRTVFALGLLRSRLA